MEDYNSSSQKKVFSKGNLLITEDKLSIGNESFEIESIESVYLLHNNKLWLQATGVVLVLAGILTLIYFIGVILLPIGIIILMRQKKYFINLILDKHPYRFSIEYNLHTFSYANKRKANKVIRILNDLKRSKNDTLNLPTKDPEEFAAKDPEEYDLKKIKIPNQVEIKPGDFSFDVHEDQYFKLYFFDYCKADGQWIEKGESVCIVRIGEVKIRNVAGAIVYAKRSGVLQWTVDPNCMLDKSKVLYRLHDKGIYKNENLIENEEYKHYFYDDQQEYSQGRENYFKEWLVKDGSYVNKGDLLYMYTGYQRNKFVHKAERNGYIHIIHPVKYSIKVNDLLYFIRNTDDKRIEVKYKNTPSIIHDDFSKKTNVVWERVSSDNKLGYGIVSKSDDSFVDLIFTFNYLQDIDYIVLHFKPEQIKPKENDKVLFMFENGEIIEFKIDTNPIQVLNRCQEKILEYRTPITNVELKLFMNKEFKKWKIELKSENRYVLGGEYGSLVDYETKGNLQIVIKKFANDYLSFVEDKIPSYKPFENRSIDNNADIKEDKCYVYLMYDTSNGYHKIGISNNPSYREKTLQSEKPTIELITAKNYPVRKIAESIERSLHNVYADKRIRGEWFELESNDIKHIIETLK